MQNYISLITSSTLFALPYQVDAFRDFLGLFVFSLVFVYHATTKSLIFLLA